MMKAYSANFTWADGEYPFALNIGQVRELEALKGIGIGAIYQRMVSGAWYGDDAYHVIRLGLIGGGMKPDRALQLCEVYVLSRPLAESIPPAIVIMQTRLFAQDAGKDQAPSAAESPRAE